MVGYCTKGVILCRLLCYFGKEDGANIFLVQIRALVRRSELLNDILEEVLSQSIDGEGELSLHRIFTNHPILQVECLIKLNTKKPIYRGLRLKHAYIRGLNLPPRTFVLNFIIKSCFQ